MQLYVYVQNLVTKNVMLQLRYSYVYDINFMPKFLKSNVSYM